MSVSDLPSACRELIGVCWAAADLERRLAPVYALLGLKGCLIVLNPFLRAPKQAGAATLRAERLVRAHAMLARARREFDSALFPFSGK